MSLRSFLRIGCLALLPFLAHAADTPEASSPRERLRMDTGWRFILGDPAEVGTRFDIVEPPSLAKTYLDQYTALPPLLPPAPDLGADVSYVAPAFDDQKWAAVQLPHDWVAGLPFGGQNEGGQDYAHGQKDIRGAGVGWYRRQFALTPDDLGKTLWIEFDGVYRNSLVWLNGHCLGRERSGYASFWYDIAKYAVAGENTLVVRADIRHDEGWFYEGGGIYRHVWLVKAAPIHVAHWGTYVASEVHGGDAVARIETTVENAAFGPAEVRLVSTVLDPAGKVVGTQATRVSLAPRAAPVVIQQVPVPAAQLWAPETPRLYTLVSTVEVDGHAIDSTRTPFGVRTLRFDPAQGFFLNGKHVEVLGTCNHQDHAGVGTAIPDRLQAWRLQQLQAMGSNACRTSHNAPTPEFLDGCDRLGLLVMDENRRMDLLPDTLRDLANQIRRDRNHPSVFMWSLGNEEGMQGTPEGAKICAGLRDTVRALDTTRPCTVAMNGDWGKGFSDIVDVQGFNYLNNGDIDAFHKAFPAKPSIATEEASALSTRGIYVRDDAHHHLTAYDDTAPKWGSTAEAWWKFFAARPFLQGGFAWTGFDYRGEPTPFKDGTLSQFGILDLCGFPKDTFYYYRAWWTAAPMVHLLPHWNWAGKEGQPIRVVAYSNCPEVELFLNGKSLGRKKMPVNSHLEWQVPYAPGTLEAKGYAGTRIAAAARVETTGAPAALRLIPDRAAIAADGEDVAIVRVEALDAQGRPVPTADTPVAFTVEGGTLLGTGNGDPDSRESEQVPQRKLFSGLAQLIVRAPDAPSPVTIRATAPGLKSAELVVNAQEAAPRPSVP
jgi:beta-galactosidase